MIILMYVFKALHACKFMDNYTIRAKLLFALARHRKWGESHTAYENMLKQFRSQSLGRDGMKLAAKKVVLERRKQVLEETFREARLAIEGMPKTVLVLQWRSFLP